LKRARAAIYGYFVIIMILLPFATYYVLNENQKNSWYYTYDFVSTYAEDQICGFFETNFDTMSVAGTIFSEKCPSADDWPNCTISINSFDAVASSVTKISSMKALRIAPILLKNEVTNFESFAFDFFASEDYPDLGTSELGQVMWGRNASDDNSIYHSTEEFGGGKYPIFTPVYFTGNAINSSSIYMYICITCIPSVLKLL